MHSSNFPYFSILQDFSIYPSWSLLTILALCWLKYFAIIPLILFKEPKLPYFFPHVFITETSSLVFTVLKPFFFSLPCFWLYMILAISAEFCFHILSNSKTPERKFFWDWAHTLPEMNHPLWAALSGPGFQVSFYRQNTSLKWSFWHLYLGVIHRSILYAAHFKNVNLSWFTYISRFFSILNTDQHLFCN